MASALVVDPTADPRWLAEATAEWGAHQAEVASAIDWEDSDWADELTWPDGPPARYADSLTLMLNDPARRLSFSNGLDREYGAFVLAEFLEEWAPEPGTFAGTDAVTPDPDIVRDIWDAAGEGATSLEAIAEVLGALTPAASFADLLPAYYRAVYLLNASGVPGTFRDTHADEWRAKLVKSRADAKTAGDPDLTGARISTTPRAGRRRTHSIRSSAP